MTNDPTAESGALIRIKVVTAEFVTSHTTNRMDEIGTIQVFEPVLIRVVGVGPTVKVVGRRVLPTFLVTCIL